MTVSPAAGGSHLHQQVVDGRRVPGPGVHGRVTGHAHRLALVNDLRMRPARPPRWAMSAACWEADAPPSADNTHTGSDDWPPHPGSSSAHPARAAPGRLFAAASGVQSHRQQAVILPMRRTRSATNGGAGAAEARGQGEAQESRRGSEVCAHRRSWFQPSRGRSPAPTSTRLAPRACDWNGIITLKLQSASGRDPGRGNGYSLPRDKESPGDNNNRAHPVGSAYLRLEWRRRRDGAPPGSGTCATFACRAAFLAASCASSAAISASNPLTSTRRPSRVLRSPTVRSPCDLVTWPGGGSSRQQ